jgi:hypothetical protein
MPNINDNPIKELNKRGYEITELTNNNDINHYNDLGDEKILEVYNDYINNILKTQKKICIHKYLTKCITTTTSPGLGDFLRGTVRLYKCSEIYNYNVFIDKNIHPFFSFFEDHENYINDGSRNDIIELMGDNQNFQKKLEELFEKNEKFSILTTLFYTKNENGIYTNYGKIPENIQNKLKNLLVPNKIVKDKLEDVFKNIYKLNKEEKYKVIHIRTGDKYLVNNETYNNHDDYIKNLLLKILLFIKNDDTNYKYILISDSKEFALDITKFLPRILYWDNKKTHIGYLNNEDGLLDTIIDFITLSKSEEIVSNGSGFSEIVSEIYNIKNTPL